MSDLTTISIYKSDHKRITDLRIAHMAKTKRQISQQDFMSILIGKGVDKI